MASITINVLTDVKQRGHNRTCYGITEDNRIVEITILPDETTSLTPLATKLQKGSYFVLQQYSINERDGATYIRLTSGKSKIFQTGKKFDIAKETLKSFFNPPTCTVPEALASPKKRRLSIDGTVTEIYAIRSGNNWQRRDVILEDPTTKKKICVKLWNDHADSISQDTKGKLITLNNVEVDIFNTKRQLRSTDLTTITTVITPKKTGNYKIIGVDHEENKLSLITECGTVLEMSETLLQTIDMKASDFVKRTPIDVRLDVDNNHITKIVLDKTNLPSSS